MQYRDSGFTLTELVLVVAVVMLGAAVVVPNLVERRNMTHEATAVGVLRTVATAEKALEKPGLDFAKHDRVINVDEVVLAEEPYRRGFVRPGFSVAERRGYRIEVRVLTDTVVSDASYSGAISARDKDALVFAKYNVNEVGTVELAPRAIPVLEVIEFLPE